jgi:hypothetical protein
VFVEGGGDLVALFPDFFNGSLGFLEGSLTSAHDFSILL